MVSVHTFEKKGKICLFLIENLVRVHTILIRLQFSANAHWQVKSTHLNDIVHDVIVYTEEMTKSF